MPNAVLITGASGGIGAVYADRFARRGHDLVLVARDRRRMQDLGARLEAETRVAVEVLPADLTNPAELLRIETRVRGDARIGILVNAAGTCLRGSFVQQSPGDVGTLIELNVTAPARLASAVAPRFALAGDGAIINVASAVALVPEAGLAVYGAAKAFILFLSRGLDLELGPKGVYVQAVLPTIAALAGACSSRGTAELDAFVDAALAGFDRRDRVTAPLAGDQGPGFAARPQDRDSRRNR